MRGEGKEGMRDDREGKWERKKEDMERRGKSIDENVLKHFQFFIEL